jgi:hypothetical protein
MAAPRPRLPAFTLAELCARDGFCMLCGVVSDDWDGHVADVHPAHAEPDDGDEDGY